MHRCARQDPVRRHPRQAPCRRVGNLGESTVTTQQIDRAWSQRNGLANIAIACGPSNLVVLDEDQADELARWCTAYGITLPHTYEVSTGRGRHLYYHWDHSEQPIGNGSKVFDGYKIDVRGKGGCVIAEGSRHASGADYVGNGQPIVDLPQQVADLHHRGPVSADAAQLAARPDQSERNDDPRRRAAPEAGCLRGATAQVRPRPHRGGDPVPRTLAAVRTARRTDPRGSIPHSHMPLSRHMG